MGIVGVESRICVQLNNFNIVIKMPEIGYHFTFTHSKPFIINCKCAIPSILCSKCPQKAVLSCILSQKLIVKSVHTELLEYHSYKGFPKALSDRPTIVNLASHLGFIQRDTESLSCRSRMKF